VKFLGALIVAAALAAGSSAMAQSPVPFINPQQMQIPATGKDFNDLIASIDSVLNPLLPAPGGGAAATGGISLNAGTSGVSPTISTYSNTGATSVNLKIAPLGNGKIILFQSNISPMSTGIIKVANSPSWVPTQGLTACPGGLKSLPTMNGSTSGTITGYLLIQDWKESVHAVPTC
jgi:hypothetical protein